MLAGACSPSLSRNPLFDAIAPGSWLTMMQDTVVVVVKDYFPALDRVEKVESDAFTLLPYSTWDTVQVIATEATPLISSLDVYSRGQHGSLAVRMGNHPLTANNMEGTGAPRLAVFEASAGSDALCLIKVAYGPARLLVFWQNNLVEEVEVTDQYALLLPGATALMERSYVRVLGYNQYGLSNDLLIPLEKGRVVQRVEQLKRTDKQTQIMYQIFVDRFCNGDISNDRPLNSPEVLPKVDYMGGDLQGITLKIQSGFFKDLGVNTLWLSPISQNPYDAWGQINDPVTRFSGYHGYWPVYITQIDDRFGTDAQFNTLLRAAHGNNENVILDYVANHMHINSPTLKAHPDWTTSPVTPDGRPNFELWDEYRLTTWFDKHIPKFDFSRPDVCDALSDSALFWLEKYDIDGFRHDATKHIDNLFWRTLTQKVVTRFPQRSVYQIGETYGSPELIAGYVKSGLLDGQFDFNVYDAYINATVRPGGSFTDLWNVISQSLTGYGYHNLMGYISGNHDRPRYISLAGGAVDPDEDTKLAGWKRDIGVGNPVAYTYMAMLHAMNMTLPGVPCIYYGDEFGMPGANDPDCRRMMVFDDYDTDQTTLKLHVQQLTHMRAHALPLLCGDLFPLYVSEDVLAYVRVYLGKAVAVCLNKGPRPFDIRQVALPFDLPWDDFDVVTEVTAPGASGPGYTILMN